MAILETAAAAAAADAAKLAAGTAVKAAAELGAAEVKKLVVEKAVELTTPAGLKKAAVTAAASTASGAARKAVKKKIKADVKEKTGMSFDADVKLTVLEKKLLLYFRKADEDTRKQVLDLLEKAVGDLEDSCLLIDSLLGQTEPGLKDTIEAVKEYLEDEKKSD